jgi:hypothetical protein
MEPCDRFVRDGGKLGRDLSKPGGLALEVVPGRIRWMGSLPGTPRPLEVPARICASYGNESEINTHTP